MGSFKTVFHDHCYHWLDIKWYRHHRHHRQKPHLMMFIKYGGIIFGGTDLMFTLPDDRKAQLTVVATDIDGHPAPIDNIRFVSSDETIVTVDSTGILSAITLGNAVVTVTASPVGQTNDLVATLDVTVAGGTATSITVSAALI